MSTGPSGTGEKNILLESVLVESMFCGPSRLIQDPQGEWQSGLFKSMVSDPTWLSWDNLEGDEQADRVHHGGQDKAICAYPSAHYSSWRAELDRPFTAGAFGENFSVNVTEDQVCLGDIFSLGDAIIEVSQPRQPCYKIARRWNSPQLIAGMLQTARSGWYFRVLQQGYVAVGAMSLMDRPYPDWTVLKAFQVRFGGTDLDAMAALASCAALPTRQRRDLLQKAMAR